MAITDPQAIRFVNEVIRPLSEEARALKARIAAAQTQWFAGLNQAFPNDISIVEDGRHDTEGVSVLTGANVNSSMSVLIGAANQLNDEIVSLPCVRQLEVR